MLESWIVKNQYKSYDPFDGLSTFLRPLTFGRRFPQQALQQFVRRNPFNLRPIMGIKPHTSTKGMGFLASGYLQLFEQTGDEKYRAQAEFCFDWLINNHTEGYSGICWGNSFDYISRGFYLPKHAPTIVWSGLIGHHFIEGYRTLGNPRYLEIAKSVGEVILKDLPRIPGPKGVCLSYVVHEPVAVHNANLLGARLLSDLYKETGEMEYMRVAHDAVLYSVSGQLPDGAWYYGEEEKFHWIDNWHTAYNLDAILDYQLNTGSKEFESAMLNGLAYYIRHFFREDGAPKYYWNRDYKYDIQSASQSIDTLTLFGNRLDRKDLIDLAELVAWWTIDNMQDRDGYFYLWKNTWITNKTPTFHWGAATMFRALAHLLHEVD